VPVSIGALATLYNASCIAADAPTILELLPEFALELPIPPGYPSSGNHFFQGASPVFSIVHPNLGVSTLKKLTSCNAPSTAPMGKDGKGFGSVPWLKLVQVSGAPALQNVYRLNTAGGAAPPNCQGMASSFQVPYSAEYVLPSASLPRGIANRPQVLVLGHIVSCPHCYLQ